LPDLEAVAAGADTERVPFAFLEKGGDAFTAASLRIDIALGPGVETAGHVDHERVRVPRFGIPVDTSGIRLLTSTM
jgi:hypothetical protein